jgi:hypothetical protein
MSEPDKGGPEWYYAIPEERRKLYERKREQLRSDWWANRLRDPSRAIASHKSMEALEEELARDYPLTPYRKPP